MKYKQCKMVILGESSVGKTSLAIRIVRNEFFESNESTIGAAFLSHTVQCKDGNVKYEVWDTAGQERYMSLAPMYYRNASVALIVYDITNINSFSRARYWVNELKKKGPDNIIIALVGNKIDKEVDRTIDTQVAIEYAKQNNLEFIETSAMTAENIRELFIIVSDKVIALTKVESSVYLEDLLLLDTKKKVSNKWCNLL